VKRKNAMAEKEKAKEPEKSKEHAGKKKHLHQVITTQAHDGTWSHEHVYKDHKHSPHSHPPVFAGTSQSMEDMHQHNDDHWGPQAGGEGEPAEAGAQGPPEEAAEGAGGGAAPMAPGGGGPPQV
jgi:hypothetical protein